MVKGDFMNIDLGLNIFEKALSLIKTLFWKNKNIVYIDSNVKNLNIEEIRPLIKPSDSKIINCQSKKSSSLRDLNRHFLKMRINLFQILRNIRDSSNIIYCGFCSSMFSVFDGYQVGNNIQFHLIDFRSEYYLIDSNALYLKKEDFIIDDSKEEINIVVSSSYSISESKIKNVPTYSFDILEPQKIDCDYLKKVYSFIKNILDSCGGLNIKKVNIYIAAKQSVNFVVGTAIQNYHPRIFIYEYRDNRFKYCMDLFKNKIMEIED